MRRFDLIRHFLNFPLPAHSSRLRAATLFVLGTGASLLFPATAWATTIEAINHTHWAINRFSVDGRSGIDIIGPHEGGGGGCCYSAPQTWQPGMTVLIDWETGAGSSAGFPGFADEANYLSWRNKMRAQKRQHTKTVPIPDYANQPVCGITVHFLPCDDIKVTTSCHAFGSPEYPIKIPLHLPEPQSCPS